MRNTLDAVQSSIMMIVHSVLSIAYLMCEYLTIDLGKCALAGPKSDTVEGIGGGY